LESNLIFWDSFSWSLNEINQITKAMKDSPVFK
jgi:hypothetical protein